MRLIALFARGIRARLIVGMAAIVIAAMAAGVVPILSIATDQAETNARDYASELSRRHGAAVAARLGEAMEVARTVRDAVLTLRETGATDRDLADALLRRQLAEHPNVLGVWVGLEPDAFGANDAEFAGSDGHDASGRYVPYWYRDNGEIGYAPLVDYTEPGAGDYYLAARDSGREVVLDPFLYAINGVDVLMTSVTTPLIVDGKVIGVAGVDLAMTDLQNQLADIRPYETGYGTLASHSGMIVTHPDSALVTQSLNVSGFGGDVLTAVTEGRAVVSENAAAFDGDGAIQVAAPIVIGETGAPWSFIVTIPRDKVFAAADTLQTNALAIAAAAIVAAIAVAWFIGGGIAGPILQMTRAMQRLAEGNTETEIPCLGRRDETGQMAETVEVFKHNAIEAERLRQEQRESEQAAQEDKRRAMTALADQFNAEVGEVVQAVTSASTELESTAQSMGQVAEQTSQQSSIVASSAHESAANVQTVAAATEQLTASISEIGTQVADSARMARSAVDEVAKANRQITGLATAADKIGSVIDLINEIAEQTNLLALNATIEAARAGEAGKGFAVVAQEVKSLASQTANATSEIGGHISSVQAETTDAVAAIESIGQTISRIDQIATSIAAAVEQQTASTDEISRNVQQAASGTQDVTQTIASVNDGAQATGTAAEQVLSAVKDLSGLADTLRGKVDGFLNAVRAA